MSECDGQPKSEPKDMSENEKPAAWVRAAAEEADAATRAFERAYARFLDPAEYAEPPMPKPERPDYVAVIAAHAPKVSQSAIEVADDAMYQGLLDGDPADSFAQAVKVNERRDRLAMIIQEARDVPAGPTHPSLWKPSQPAEEAADKYFDVVDYPSVNAQYEALAAIIQSAIDAATGPLETKLAEAEKERDEAITEIGVEGRKRGLAEAELKEHRGIAEFFQGIEVDLRASKAEAERLTAAAESVAKQLVCVCEPCYTDRGLHASDCKAYLADEFKQALLPEDAE